MHHAAPPWRMSHGGTRRWTTMTPTVPDHMQRNASGRCETVSEKPTDVPRLSIRTSGKYVSA